MADYKDIQTMLSILNGITYTRNNTRQDDGTDTLSNTGIDWFKFNGVVPTNIYANGNGYIGFGSDSEHLRINRRDQAMYYLGYETGVVGFGLTYRYYRIYWKGVSHYSSPQTTDNTLEFDTVLLETGDIYINIRTFPTNNVSNDNTILSNGSNTSLGTLTTGSQLTLIHQDEDGRAFTINQGIIEPEYAEVRYLFGDSNNKVYTVIDGALSEITDELTGNVFLNQGTETIPSEAIRTLQGLKVYKWQDGGETELNLKLTATPLPQYVSCVADMSHESITGIASIGCSYDGTVNIQYSYDGTTYTSKMSVTDFLAISPDTLYDGLGIENKIYFKFWLEDDTSALTNLVIRYQNTK
jgi:hypothetical protein